MAGLPSPAADGAPLESLVAERGVHGSRRFPFGQSLDAMDEQGARRGSDDEAHPGSWHGGDEALVFMGEQLREPLGRQPLDQEGEVRHMGLQVEAHLGGQGMQACSRRARIVKPLLPCAQDCHSAPS